MKIGLVRSIRRRSGSARRFIKTVGEREEGATMIEFAIAFPAFLFFFFGIMEIAFMTFGNAMIENIMNQSARLGMVGCQRNEFVLGTCDAASMVDPVKIKQDIQAKTYGLVNACDPERFSFSVAPVGTAAAGDPEANTINLGQGDEVVVYASRYRWRIFNPFLHIRQVFGSYVDYEYATMVRNERFGDMGDVRVRANDGC